MAAALRHGEVLTLDGAPVRLNVNPRARRVSLRIDGRAGVVVATAPSARTLAQAVAFALTRSEWIAARLGAAIDRTALAPGVTIPVRGQLVLLTGAARASAAARLDETMLSAGGEGEAFARRIRRWLAREALADLTARTAHHAAALGMPTPPVAVADARTRWGSCAPPRPGAPLGRIRYSWRLVCAPPAVLDYVAAHEVAHLAEANHSPAFWAVVDRLYGNPTPERRWLKQHGAALHRIG